MSQIPRQKLPRKKKTREWGIKNLDAFISISAMHSNTHRADLERAYKAYNGVLDINDYQRYLHFGAREKKSFPAQIRNYPIIRPIIDRLAGEKRIRPFNYHVICVNGDTDTLKTQQLNEKMKGAFEGLVATHLQELGINTGASIAPPQDPESIVKEFSKKYKDKRAIAGQHIMNYIVQKQEVKYKSIRNFMHWLIAGEAYTYKHIIGSEVKYDIINPPDIDFDLDPDLIFVEDADYVICRRFMHASSVIDYFYDELSPDEIVALEEENRSTALGQLFIPFTSPSHGNDSRIDRLIEVVHVTWKSRKMLQHVTYVDSFGRPQETFLNEDESFPAFKANVLQSWIKSTIDSRRIENSEQVKQQLLQEIPQDTSDMTPEEQAQFEQQLQQELDARLQEMPEETLSQEEINQLKQIVDQMCTKKEIWVNEIWEGTRIDNRINLRIRPHPVQRRETDNPSICKQPYNGRIFSNLNAPNISLVMLGIPYQINFNIYRYRLELAIAKSKDNLAVFDINMIPKGWDMDKFMHFLEGTGIVWVDYTKEGIKLNPQQQAVLNMSIQTIESYIALLASIIEEWERLSGVTRQRQGDISSRDGLGTTQQAIIQSGTITEELFARYGELEERDLQGLLEYAKIAWPQGKRINYITPDGTQQMYNVDPDLLAESDLGVFVVNSTEETNKLERAQALAERFAQGGASMLNILEILDTKSFTDLKEKIRVAEENAQKLQQAQLEAEQAMEAQKAEAEAQKIELEYEKLDREDLNKELDRQTDILIAEIQASNTPGSTTNINIEDNSDEMAIKAQETFMKGQDMRAKQALETQKVIDNELEAKRKERQENQKMSLEQAKLKHQMKKDAAELQLKAQELKIKDKAEDIKLKVAKENKNKHDSKK